MPLVLATATFVTPRADQASRYFAKVVTADGASTTATQGEAFSGR